MKKVLAIILAFAMVFLFAGCSTEKKAEKTVDSFLSAIKNVDMEEANKYVDGAKEDSLFDNENAAFLGALLERMDYVILSSEKVDEDNVNVVVSVTNTDMKPVLGEFLMQALKYSFESMNAEIEPTEEEVNAKMTELLTECLNKEELTTITLEANCKVTKSESGWKIIMDGELSNAILGGLDDAAKELQSSLS